MGEIALGPSNVGLRVQHGLFQLNYSREDFFGGSVFSLLQLDVRGEEPLATAHTMARSVDYGLALEALGVTDQIRVKTDTVLQFEGRGATMGKVLERGKFQLRAGPTTVFLHDPTGGDLVEIEISKVAASVAAGDHVAFAVAGRFRNEPFAINLRGGTLRSLFEGHEQWPIKLSARAVNASLAAKGRMGPWRDGISYSLALGVKGGVITAIDPDLPAFGPYAVAMALDGGLDHVAISRLAARLGQTRINGALDVDLKGTRPRIQGSLVSPRLRLEDVVKTTKTPLPVEALRAFDVDVAIRAQRVVVGPVVLADVTAEARFEQGVLRFSPIQGKVPDREGSPADLQASFELDVVQVPPVLSIEAQAKNLNYGRILRSMKVTNRIQGAGDFEVGLTSQAMKIETMVTRSTINVQTNNMRMAVGVGHGTEPRRLRISDATVSTIKGGPLQVTVTGTIQDTPFSLKSTGGTLKGFLAQTGRWPVGLTGRVGNALAVMEGHLNLPFDGENFTFQMALNGDRLSDLDPLVGQSFPKWGPFGATGTLVETKDGYDVTGLKGQIAGGDVSGSVSIGTKGLRPRVVADLTSEKMLLPRETRDTLPLQHTHHCL